MTEPPAIHATRLAGRGLRWMTAREIANASQRPIGTIYWLAHRDHWPRDKTRRPTLYRVDKVDDTLNGPLDT